MSVLVVETQRKAYVYYYERELKPVPSREVRDLAKHMDAKHEIIVASAHGPTGEVIVDDDGNVYAHIARYLYSPDAVIVYAIVERDSDVKKDPDVVFIKGRKGVFIEYRLKKGQDVDMSVERKGGFNEVTLKFDGKEVKLKTTGVLFKC